MFQNMRVKIILFVFLAGLLYFNGCVPMHLNTQNASVAFLDTEIRKVAVLDSNITDRSMSPSD